MSFHRFDSSAVMGKTVRRAAKHIPNALRGVSERLNSMSIERLSGVRGVSIPQPIASAPSGGGASKSAKAELYSLFMGSYSLPIGEIAGVMRSFN
jgi:hypothetical protein